MIPEEYLDYGAIVLKYVGSNNYYDWFVDCDGNIYHRPYYGVNEDEMKVSFYGTPKQFKMTTTISAFCKHGVEINFDPVKEGI